MEATQRNNSTTPNQENPDTATSQDLKEKTNKLINAATDTVVILTLRSAGVPPQLVPVVKIGVDVAISAANDPKVQEQVSQFKNQIESTTKEAYTRTVKSVSNAAEKTKQVVSNTYNNTIEKASQGINAAKEQIPWEKVPQIATSLIVPPTAVPALVQIYQRVTTAPPSNPLEEENRPELRSKL